MTASWIDKLSKQGSLPPEGYRQILLCGDPSTQALLHTAAQEATERVFGRRVYLRGLIEITSHCRNNCYYCGLRASNSEAERYRLSQDEILECCQEGYNIGLRTFVLQGGEDPSLGVEAIEKIVGRIAQEFPSCAITLSLGEHPRGAYERFFAAGASRYLLRHESFNEEHYSQLHPAQMSRHKRLEALESLKEIGFQVGSGIMVGSPHQSIDHIVEDILFIERFKPHMIGIGPFVSHHSTPFAAYPNGDIGLTLKLLSIFRLINPLALIPSTTALATLLHNGHQAGIQAGENVIMPNLSPPSVRAKYAIYDNKAAWGSEAAQGIEALRRQLCAIGYEISMDRGDSPMINL